jgi:hypothetical protein
MERKSVCFRLVSKLAELDTRFVQDYAPDISDAECFPHSIMASFAQFLCHQFNNSALTAGSLCSSAMTLLEENLRTNYQEVQNIIEVSFIEKVFYENQEFFAWMLDHAGELLKYEMLAFQAKERGYKLINAIRDVFGPTPPDSISTMINNPVFLRRLADLQVPTDDGIALDSWGQPYEYHLEIRKPGRNIIWIVSRGQGINIEICG